MSNRVTPTINTRSHTRANEMDSTLSSLPTSSTSTSSNTYHTELTAANIPIYDIHDVIYVLANVGYTQEVKRFVFLNNDHYHDERLLLPLQYQPYGKYNNTLFQVACALNHIDRVKELLRYNANPDVVYSTSSSGFSIKRCLSALAEALFHGHYEIVQYLMTNYYEPKFRNWELRHHHHITKDNIPVTEPIPKDKNNNWYEYQILSSKNISLFSSIDEFTFCACELPFRLLIHFNGGFKMQSISSNMIKAFHALLYKSIPNPNNNTDPVSSISAYSCFWKSAIAKQWLPYLVAWMILCNEPHSIDTILNSWDDILPTNYVHDLAYYAAIAADNIPLFSALVAKYSINLNPRRNRNIMVNIASYGSVDLFREFHQSIKQFDIANANQQNYNIGHKTILDDIGRYTLHNPNVLAILKYIRDYTPPARPWDEWTIATAARMNRLDIINFLRNEVDPPCKWNKDTYESTTDESIRQWLKDNGCPTKIDEKVERDDGDNDKSDDNN